MEKQENVVRTVLKNEITWVLAILLAGWGIVVNVIIPIADIQTTLLSIGQNQQDIKKFEQQQTTTNEAVNSRISVLEALAKIK